VALADGFETSSFAAFVSKFDSATCLAFGIGVDGSCCSEIVSPASYNMPELGCSRRAGFGDTNNGGACGTIPSNLGIFDPKFCGCGEYSDVGEGVRGGTSSLGTFR